jgi:hypothetical protein
MTAQFTHDFDCAGRLWESAGTYLVDTNLGVAASHPVDQRYHLVGFGIVLNDYFLYEKAPTTIT